MSKERRPFSPIDFKDRFPALDGIRALAITLVFCQHFGGGSHGGPFLRAANQLRLRGWTGVTMFFVLSGFLITGILYDTRHDSQFFKRFFMRRAVRIFPIFYLVVLLLLILTPILHYHLRWGHLLFLAYLGNFIGNYDFSYYSFISAQHPYISFNISHFWTLCVEEQFYLLWPLVVWLIRDRVRLIRTAFALSLLSILFRVLMAHFTNPSLAERWIVRTLPFQMDGLLIGAILALLLRGPAADRWQRLCLPLFAVAAPIAAAMLAFATWNAIWYPALIFTVLALASAGLIGMALRTDSFVFRPLYWKPFRALGRYSYGFYVYHDIFGWTWIMFFVYMSRRLHSLALGGGIELVLNFVTIFIVSKLSYDFFEVKFLRLKRHFEYDSEVVEHKHAFTTR